MYDPDASPFNQLPPLVVALSVFMIGIEILFQMAEFGLIGGVDGVGWRIGAIRDFGWHDQIYHWMLDNRAAPWEALRRLATYPLLHPGMIEALLATVFVLALGKLTAEAFGQFAFLFIFVLSSLAGALAMGVLTNSTSYLIGGYPGAFGLIGAFTYLRYMGFLGDAGRGVQAFTLIALLAGLQALFSFLNGDFGQLAAELGGFAAGFAASFVVRPGGLRDLRARLRGRR